MVNPGRSIFLALYHDQVIPSTIWRKIKKFYNQSPNFIRFLLIVSIGLSTECAAAIVRVLTLRNPLPFKTWNEQRKRGMSIWHDLVDWVGGYPFEVAKPEEIFDFYQARNYTLQKLITKRAGQGCCEYVFRKCNPEKSE